MKYKICVSILAFLLAAAGHTEVVPPTGFTQGPLANETYTKVHVSTKDMYGKQGDGDVTVTIYMPVNPHTSGPYPTVVVNHGRNNATRSVMTRPRYESVARVFASAGYVVLVPQRLGYGPENAAFDPEGIDCKTGDYRAVFDAGADQINQVVKWAQTLSYVKRDDIYLVGHSAGGAAAIAAAVRNPPGVRAMVNFAGGYGGLKATFGLPCFSKKVEYAYKDFGGEKSNIPQMWIYSENDHYFDPKFAKEWFQAFQSAGGNGTLTIVPPELNPKNGESVGHDYIVWASQKWRNDVLAFFNQNKAP